MGERIQVESLFGSIVTSEPTPIFEAAVRCKVYLWVNSTRADGVTPNPAVRVSKATDPMDEDAFYGGILVPYNTGFGPIYMDPGDLLYATTVEEADVAVSVVPAGA